MARPRCLSEVVFFLSLPLSHDDAMRMSACESDASCMNLSLQPPSSLSFS